MAGQQMWDFSTREKADPVKHSLDKGLAWPSFPSLDLFVQSRNSDTVSVSQGEREFDVYIAYNIFHLCIVAQYFTNFFGPGNLTCSRLHIIRPWGNIKGDMREKLYSAPLQGNGNPQKHHLWLHCKVGARCPNGEEAWIWWQAIKIATKEGSGEGSKAQNRSNTPKIGERIWDFACPCSPGAQEGWYQSQEKRNCPQVLTRSGGEASLCMQQAVPQIFFTIQNDGYNRWWELFFPEKWPDSWELQLLLLWGCPPVCSARKCSVHDQEQVSRDADGVDMHFMKGNVRTFLCPQKSLNHWWIVPWKVH